MSQKSPHHDNNELDNGALERLAEEYLSQLRAGLHPQIEHYVQRFPDRAQKIRETLEAIEIMERLAPRSDSESLPSGFGSEIELSKQSRRIGDYLIVREIGRGGMGVVYEAEQVSLGRRVALKLIPQSSLPDSNASMRFKREAKAAAKLHHTNIVPVFGIGEDSGYEYYAMQFIQGESLDRVLCELRRLNPSFVRTSARAHDAPPVATRFQHSSNVSESKDSTAKSVCPTELDSNLAFSQSSHPGRAPRIANSLISCAHSTFADPSRPYQPSTDATGSQVDAFHGTTNQARDSLFAHSPVPLDPSTQGEAHYWQAVARIGAQVASAVDYAHQQKVMHRDIKPGNILLDFDGTTWLTDFGLAKMEDDFDLTRTGDILGTLRYMAPENFHGIYDQRSEIYCIGLTLYELCSLQSAYENVDRGLLFEQVRAARFVPLNIRNAQVPIDVRTIVHKCLEREPKDRYATAGELEADLRRFMNGEPIHARRTSILERFRRWSRRNKQLAVATVSLGLTMCVLAIGGPIMAAYLAKVAERNSQLAIENGELATIANEERNQAREAKLAAEEARDRAIQINYSRDMSRAAENALNDGPSSLTDRLVDAWRNPGMKYDPRGWEWHWLKSHQHAEQQLVYSSHADVRCVAFQPQGNLLAASDVSLGLRLLDRQTGKQIHFVPQELAVIAAWEPSGESLISLSADGQALRFDAKTGQSKVLCGANEATATIRWMDWKPDASSIAVAYVDRLEVRDSATWKVLTSHAGQDPKPQSRSSVAKWNEAGDRIAWARGDRLQILNQDLEPAIDLSGEAIDLVGMKWTPERYLITVCRSGKLTTFDTDTGAIVSQSLIKNVPPVLGADWSSDGSRVVIACDQVMAIANTQTGIVENRWIGYGTQFESYAQNVDWSQDDQYLSVAYQGMFAPVPIWQFPTEIRESTLPNAIRRMGHNLSPVPGRLFAWSPSGERIASLGESVQVWDVASRKINKSLEIPRRFLDEYKSKTYTPNALHIEFSPNEKYLAVTEHDLYVWELSSGQLILESSPPASDFGAISWSFDSRYLAVASLAQGPVHLWDTDTNSLTQLDAPPHDFGSHLCWHPSQHMLLFNSATKTICWDLEKQSYGGSSGSSEAWSFRIGLEGEGIPKWSRKGDLFASNTLSRCILVVDAKTKSRQVLEGHSELVQSLSWGCNDSRLVSVDRSGLAIMWDTDTTSEVMRLYKDALCCEWNPIAPMLAVARSNGNIDLLDATRSYMRELPLDLSPSLEKLPRSTVEQGNFLARRQRWSEIEYLEPQNPLWLGWWTSVSPADTF